MILRCRFLLGQSVIIATLIGTSTIPVGRIAHAQGSRSVTWYWQNPVPRDYRVQSIACRSATSCVAVGAGGLIVTTRDGGRRWTNRHSGTAIDITSVACPGRSTCYALAFAVTGYGPTWQPQGTQTAFLRSADGGKTWQLAAPPPAVRTHF